MTKVDKVLRALRKDELTSRQIASRFQLANPRDAIYKLRNRGYDIELVEGAKSRKYSMYA